MVALLTPANAQRKSAWLGAGFAVSMQSNTITADLNLQTGKHFFITMPLYFNAKYNSPFYYSSTTSIGIGGGYLIKSGALMLAASSGLALNYRYYEYLDQNLSVGIPVKLQIFLSTKWMGLGLNTIYKFNAIAIRNYGGLGLVLGLGRMR